MTRLSTVHHRYASVWPPPRWPGCPGTRRYKQAIRKVQPHPQICTAFQQTQPPEVNAKTKQGHTDARLLWATMDANDYYSACIADTTDDGYDITIPYILSLAEDVSEQKVIPCVIITDFCHGQPNTVTLFLSRHTRWMGISPNLPYLNRSHAIVYTYDGETPQGIIAIPEKTFQTDLSNIRDASVNTRLAHTPQGKAIDRILRYHGAAPHYISIDPDIGASATLIPVITYCVLASQEPDEEPFSPPLATGELWDRRN